MQGTNNDSTQFEKNFWMCRPKESDYSTFNSSQQIAALKQCTFNLSIAEAEFELSKIIWTPITEPIALETAWSF